MNIFRVFKDLSNRIDTFHTKTILLKVLELRILIREYLIEDSTVECTCRTVSNLLTESDWSVRENLRRSRFENFRKDRTSEVNK